MGKDRVAGGRVLCLRGAGEVNERWRERSDFSAVVRMIGTRLTRYFEERFFDCVARLVRRANEEEEKAAPLRSE
jgi:hypothetical protein